MSHIVATTSPNAEGEMLWCVHYKSSYFDNDPRWSGTIPVDSRIYVLAKGRDNAIEKAAAQIEKSRKISDSGAEEQIEATLVTLEDLVAARTSKSDGRLGWISGANLAEVKLSNPEDQKRYRLAVCLVPID